MLFLANFVLLTLGTGAFAVALPAIQDNPTSLTSTSVHEERAFQPRDRQFLGSIGAFNNTECTDINPADATTIRADPGDSTCIPFGTEEDNIGIVWGATQDNEVTELMAFTEPDCKGDAVIVPPNVHWFETNMEPKETDNCLSQNKVVAKPKAVVSVIFVHKKDCDAGKVPHC